MICVIRIQSQAESNALWNEVVSKKDELQKYLGVNGKILYTSTRVNSNEVSMFVHVADTNILGDFITNNLSKFKGVDAIWLLTIIKPTFFASPPDIEKMDRYTITLKVYPAKLDEVYGRLSSLKLPPGTNMTYLAYTFHLLGDCLQFSLVTNDGDKLGEYVNNTIGTMPGVLNVTVSRIKKTFLFVSHGEWGKYISGIPEINWNDKFRIEQFQKQTE